MPNLAQDYLRFVVASPAQRPFQDGSFILFALGSSIASQERLSFGYARNVKMLIQSLPFRNYVHHVHNLPHTKGSPSIETL